MITDPISAQRRPVWLRVGIVGVAAVVTLSAVAVSRDADAKKKPSAVSRRCRKLIGDNVINLAAIGLRQIAACQEQADRGSPPRAQCNVLEVTAEGGGNTSYARAQNLATARIIPGNCPDGDPALANFPSGTPTGAVGALLPTVKAVLEAGETMVQGLAQGQQKSGARRNLTRCRRAMATARNDVVNEVLRRSVRCQRRLDRRATDFGPLAAECLADGGRAGRRAAARIERACRGISGAAAGGCADLPGCVIEAAQQTAWTLARLSFPARAACGNGVVEIGESCDDGNTTRGDGCGATCVAESGTGPGGGGGRCGNAVVEPPEECDLGPNQGGDYNRTDGNCTTECQLAVCGDGLVDQVEPGVEACDDAVQDDCSGCELEGRVCTADGILANVELDYSPNAIQVHGTTLHLAYARPLDIPGTDIAPSVARRVTWLVDAPLVIAGDEDTNSDGRDDRLRLVLSDIDKPIPPGTVASVRFDCPPGTEVYPRDIGCSVFDAFPRDGSTPFPPEAVRGAGLRCGIASLEGGLITTTTTTTTTSTTRIATTTTSTTSTTTTTLITCGNGVVDPPFEQCDDGNQDNNDDCLAGTCQFNTCGDGFPDLQGPQVEECDDGNTDASDGCTNGCTICGNRIIGDLDGPNGPLPGETCDDGNRDEADFCPNDCTVDTCVPTATEVTVTANLSTPDVAALTLFIEYPEGKVDLAGSGGSVVPGRVTGPGATVQPFDFDHAMRIVEFDLFNFGTTQVANITFNRCQGRPYPSDDEFSCALEGLAVDENGAEVPGVTCSISVPPPTGLCGDTIVDPGEECDDGNTNDEDDCLTTCRTNRCGDGFIDRQGAQTEQCDDGNVVATDGCTASCTICGDRLLTAPETCDDGGIVDEDFCPADCQVDSCVPSTNELPINLVLNTPDVAALTMFLDYPEGKVDLAGSGGSIPAGSVTGPATLQAFDYDHAVRIVEFDLFNFGTTNVAAVRFQTCTGAPFPAPEDFSCRIEGDVVDENSAVVPGVTCTVSGL